jgi:phosphoglycolate phosphatase
MIGGGVPQLVGRALRARGLPGDGLMPLVEEFIALYRENLTTNTMTYEGGRELLAKLHGEGRRLGICTNKNHELTVEILQQLDLIKYFGSVLGEREGRPRKPDPAPLLEVVAELGASPRDALMAGDSEADVACARAAKMPVLVVDFGYSRIAPEALGADAVISRLSDLPQFFSDLKPRST